MLRCNETRDVLALQSMLPCRRKEALRARGDNLRLTKVRCLTGAGWCTVRNYLLRHRSCNRVLAAHVGTMAEAVSFLVDVFYARTS